MNCAVSLTEEQKLAFSDAFHMFSGAKGVLNATEFAECVRACGLYPTNQQINELASMGETNLDTFLMLMGQLSMLTEGQHADNELFEAFRVFDRNGMGTIPVAEFGNFAKILGEGFNDQELKTLLSYAQNGEIHYEQIIEMMQNSDKSNTQEEDEDDFY